MCPSYLSGFTNKWGENVWRFGGHAGEGMPPHHGVVVGDKAPDIHVVTPQEERDRAFSIFEVVLPVVDSDVRCVLPTNGVGKFLKRLVKAEGMADILKSGDNATQRCGFRSLVVRPQELDYKLIGYSDRDSDLTPSIVSVVFKQAVVAGEEGQKGAEGASHDESGGEGCEEKGEMLGRWRALVMSFTLPPSSYATMMAREIMKASTHPSDQFRLRLQLEAQEDAASGNIWQARLKNLVKDEDYKAEARMPLSQISPRSIAAAVAAEIKVNARKRERELSPGQKKSKEPKARMRDKSVKGEKVKGHAEAHSVSINVHAEPTRRQKKRSRQHVETGGSGMGWKTRQEATVI